MGGVVYSKLLESIDRPVTILRSEASLGGLIQKLAERRWSPPRGGKSTHV